MKKLYECSKCGVVTDERDHLCSAKTVDSMDAYCGSTGNAAQMCDSIRDKASCTCITCGRSAEKAEMVCNTLRLH